MISVNTREAIDIHKGHQRELQGHAVHLEGQELLETLLDRDMPTGVIQIPYKAAKHNFLQRWSWIWVMETIFNFLVVIRFTDDTQIKDQPLNGRITFLVLRGVLRGKPVMLQARLLHWPTFPGPGSKGMGKFWGKTGAFFQDVVRSTAKHNPFSLPCGS